MGRLYEFLMKHRFALIVVAAVIGLNLLPDKAVEKVRSGALEMAFLVPSPGKGSGSGRGGEKRTRKEIEILREKVRLLEGENAILRREIGASSALLRTLTLDADKSVTARVILKRGVTSHRRTILIDAGAGEGLAPGMPVVTGRTLVGVVVTTASRVSRVQLLTDPAFRAVGRLAATGEEGVIEGSGGKDCSIKMHYLKNPGSVVKGAPVFTAGTLGRFPAGLVIGSVVEKPGRPENGFTWAGVEPDLRIESLESVTVLKGYPRSAELEKELSAAEGGKKPGK